MSNETDIALGAILSLPPPQIDPADLAAPLLAHWGLSGQLIRLTGERDLNFRLRTERGEDGAGEFLVKLAHPAESLEMTSFQTMALMHVAQNDPGLPVPRVIPARDGLWVDLPMGRLRVYSWLKGLPMPQSQPSDAQAEATGAALARLYRALSGFSHPAADHFLLWDIKQTPSLAPLLPAIADQQIRNEATDFIAFFAAEISPKLALLPRQVCHSDLNRHNLLVDERDTDRIAGILDFGDMVLTQRICDLAIACSYQIDPGRPLERLARVIGGYAAIQPLLPGELELLFDLITARMVTSLAIGSWRAARYPENAEYILRNAPSARAGLHAFRSLGRSEATHAFKTAAANAGPAPERSLP